MKPRPLHDRADMIRAARDEARRQAGHVTESEERKPEPPILEKPPFTPEELAAARAELHPEPSQ